MAIKHGLFRRFVFATGWMGENHFAQIPVALYGSVLFMAAIA